MLCETPQKLVTHFGGYFDRVLVDAPCSGEGTFRIHPGEIKKWSHKFSQRSAVIQDEILWFAGKLVRPGGFLVYSTCTFNQLENEGTIIRFLEKEPGFNLDLIPKLEGFSPGIPVSVADPVDLTRTVRIWPHLSDGEGHFVARMQKTGTTPRSNSMVRTAENTFNAEQSALYQTFFNNNLHMTSRTREISPGSRELGVFGNRCYRILSGSPDLEGLNIRHWGWWLGTFQSDQFIPSPALAAGLKQEDVQTVLEFSIGDTDLASYQRGSPIKIPENGNQPGSWVLVTISSNPLGWGKVQKGRLKSHFPKWLRIN